MKVEVLGPGCKRCEQLLENATAAAGQFDSFTDIEVVKISDVHYFAKMGVFMTPGLIIDGEVVSVGKVLDPDNIKARIQEKLP
jgi:small redox-active disulfide protein 2